jgi:hypothetical protein
MASRIIVVVLGVLVSLRCFAATTLNVEYVEKSVVFLYTADDTGHPLAPLGTGFIVEIPLKDHPEKAYKLLVTARHMVDPQWAGCPNPNAPRILIRVNKKNFDPAKDQTGIEYLDTAGEVAANKEWIVSEDPQVDAAILLLQGSTVDKYDVLGVKISDFPTPDELKGLKAGADIVSAGLLPGASGTKRNYPIFKFGNISSIPDEPADVSLCQVQGAQPRFLKLWFVAANLVPGNSGSPIYFAPAMFSGQRGLLLGIQSSSIVAFDVAGMTPVEYVYELLEKITLEGADLRRNVQPAAQKPPEQPKPAEPKK